MRPEYYWAYDVRDRMIVLLEERDDPNEASVEVARFNAKHVPKLLEFLEQERLIPRMTQPVLTIDDYQRIRSSDLTIIRALINGLTAIDEEDEKGVDNAT